MLISKSPIRSMKASMNSSATAIYEGKLKNSSYVFDAEGTNGPARMAPCGSSITTNERDDLPLRARDGPGLQIGVLRIGLQMLSNPHLSLSNKHGQGHSYEQADK